MFQVHLQTQQEGKVSISRLTANIVRQQGLLALYNGLSASLCRQLTYSTARFGIYEVRKTTFYIILAILKRIEVVLLLSCLVWSVILNQIL